MSQEIKCPNCGGDHTLANPGITMLVCSFCKTTVYWDEEAVLKTGAQSILPASDSRLFLHASGMLDGRGYQVVGHVRYDHGRGAWDEWYLQLDDGSVAWLSEDQRELSQEQAVQVARPPAVDQLQIGLQVPIEETIFSVREVGTARCVGGEGQLPFTILPGETYTYADIASIDGQQFGTLEFDREGVMPTCFVGRALGHEQLTIDDEKPPSTAGGREGSHIKCTNCDAALEVEGDREVQTLICEYCGAQLDLNSAEARVLGVNPPDFKPAFNFEVGAQGTFYGKPYEVCGRMLYQDPEGYQSIEYLLYNPEAGYLWLAEETGHYVLNRPTQQAPARDPFLLPPKTSVAVDQTSFKMYESGNSTLVYVDGALPWLARTGDTFNYADLIAPPQMFGVETDGEEIEYFHGRYTPVEEVWAAFGRDDAPPRPVGVRAAQPFSRGTVAKLLMLFGALFAALNLGMLFWSMSKRGKPIFSQTFSSAEYLRETLSRPFTVTKSGKIMAMKVRAQVQNSWLYVQIGMVNAKDEVVAEADGEISYYSGYEGGESWSEGKRRSTNYFKAPKAGVYRIILKGQGGSGNFRGPPRGEAMTITVYQGGVLSRWFLAIFIFAALFPLFEILRKWLFEKRRWAPVLEDDDDDDDDDWD